MTSIDEATPSSSPAASTPGLYARDASGLVRELGTRDAFSINIGAISPASVPVLLLVLLATFPQGDFTVPILAGGAVGIVLALVYAQLIAAIPRSGGDYMYASRIFHPIVGAAVGGALFIALLLGIAPAAILFAQVAFPFLLQAAGEALSWNGLAHLATDFSSKGAQVGCAFALLAVVTAVGTLRVRLASRAIFITFLLATAAILVFIVLFLFHSNGSFQSSYNAAAGHAGAYQAVIAAAHKNGIKTGVSSSAVIGMIPFGALIFLGLTFAIYPGSELKRPSRTFLSSSLMAVAVTLVLIIGYWLTIRSTAGLNFLQASGGLATANPQALGKLSTVPASAPAYGLLLSGDPITKLLMGIGICAGLFGNVIAITVAASRLLFGLSFDRVLPSWVAAVGRRTHAPYAATAITVLGIAVCAYLGIYTTALTVLRNAVLVFEVLFTIASLGVVVLPYVRRDLYDASPKVFKGKIGGVPAMSVFGALSVILNGGLAYLAATKPQISGGYDTGSVIALAIVATIGVVAYGISRMVLSARGVDLSLAMRELPPD